MNNLRKIIPNITRKVESKISVEEEQFFATEDLTVLNDYDTYDNMNEQNNNYNMYSASTPPSNYSNITVEKYFEVTPYYDLNFFFAIIEK